MTHIVKGIQFVIAQEAAAAQAHADELKQQKRKDEEQEKADKLKAKEREAEQVAQAAIVEQHYDPVCDSVFNRDSHSAAFREIITSTNGKEYIDLNQQQPIAKAILSDFEKVKGKNGVPNYITADWVKARVRTVIGVAMGMVRQAEKENIQASAEKQWKNILTAVTKIGKSIEELNEQLDYGATIEAADVEEFFTVDFRAMAASFSDLKKRINTDDKVVNTQ